MLVWSALVATPMQVNKHTTHIFHAQISNEFDTMNVFFYKNPMFCVVFIDSFAVILLFRRTLIERNTWNDRQWRISYFSNGLIHTLKKKLNELNLFNADVFAMKSIENVSLNLFNVFVFVFARAQTRFIDGIDFDIFFHIQFIYFHFNLFFLSSIFHGVC